MDSQLVLSNGKNENVQNNYFSLQSLQSFTRDKLATSLLVNGVTVIILSCAIASPLVLVATFTSSLALDYLTNSVPKIEFFSGERKWTSFKYVLKDELQGVLTAIALNVALNILLPAHLCKSGQIVTDLVHKARRSSTLLYAKVLLYVCVIGPIAEEFLFRGMIQGKLKQIQAVVVGKDHTQQDIHKTTRVGITSILFGLAHYHPLQGAANLGIMVYTGALGVFMSRRAEEEEGCLAGSSAQHMLHNSLVMTAMHCAV